MGSQLILPDYDRIKPSPEFLLPTPPPPPHTHRLLSEYDIYREQYRLFDTALFCMPPEHRFRRFCKAVLTKQLEEPAARPLKDAEENIAKNALKLCAYFFR